MSRILRLPALCLAIFSLATAFTLPAGAETSGSKTARPVILQRVDNTQTTALHGSVVPGVRKATDLGQISADRELQMRLELTRTPEQQQALDALLAQTRTPGNAMYGKTISQREFAETFGPSVKDLAALQQWLESRGFEVTSVHGAQRTISFQGSVAQAEGAFGTEIHAYRLRNGEQRYANATSVKVPSAIVAAVRHIEGLQNFVPESMRSFDGPVGPEQQPEEKIAAEVSTSREKLNQGWSSPMTLGMLTSLRQARASAHPENQLATTTTVTIAGTQPVVSGSGTPLTVTAVVAWTSGAGPTGNLTLSDSGSALNTTINLSSCTAGTNQYTCTYTWTTPSAARTAGTDTVTATYGGDANYATSNGTNTVAITYASGAGNPTALSLTNAPNTVAQGATTQQTFTFKITGSATQGVPTGTVMLWGSGAIGKIAEITSLSQTGCTTATRAITCTVTWNPSATLPAGSYQLTASYSGNTHIASFNVIDTSNFTVTATGTTTTATTVTANPATVDAAGPVTLTTKTTWTGSGQPTGSVTLTGPAGTLGGGFLGGATYPALGQTTSSGSGTYDFGNYTYTYNCTVGSNVITCTIVDSDLYDPLPTFPGANTITATYGGDTVFKGSSGTTVVTLGFGGFFPTEASVSASPATVQFGAGTTVTYTVDIADEDGLGVQPTGTLTLTGTPIANGSAQITVSAANCPYSAATGIATCTVTSAVPVGTSSGTYTVTASYTGDGNYTGSNATASLTVTGNIPTSTTATAVPTSVNGTTPNTTVTGVTTWTGSGATPTGTMALTCGAGSGGICNNLPAAKNVSTCTIVVASKTITCAITYDLDANDTDFGIYDLVMTYSGDINYAGSSGYAAVGNGGATASTSTLTVGANPTTTYGTGPTESFTVAVKGSAGGGRPTGSVTVSNGSLGTLGTANLATGAACTSTGTGGNIVYTCNAAGTYKVPVTAAVGTYTLTFQYSGDPTYNGSSTTTTLTINKGTSTGAASNVSAGYLATVTLSATDTGATGAAAPTGTASFTVNGVTVSGTPSCSGSAAVETCTLSYALPANLVAGTYPIAVSFAADTNYGTATGSGTLTVSTDSTSTSVSASPTTITQGGSPAATTLTAIVTNTTVPAATPTGSVTFSYSGGSLGSCTLTAGSCNVSVNASALAIGANTITASYGGVTKEFAASSGTTSVTVNAPAGCSTGQLCFSSVTHNMGSVPVGQSTAGTSNYGVQVTNKGTVAYTNLKVTLGGNSPGSFSQTNNCPASLAANATCEIIFTFTPLATGQVTATWSVSGSSGFTYYPSNGGTLTGTGTPAGGVTLSTGGHNFGTVTDGTTSPVYGTVLTNSTASAVTLSFTTVTSPFHVTLNNCPATLAANASCNLQFDFAPTAPGITSQTFGISVNGGSTPITTGGVTVTGVKLTGTGQ